MICQKCGTENAPIKRSCTNCRSILEGWTINNVTGEWFYRVDPKNKPTAPAAPKQCTVYISIPITGKDFETQRALATRYQHAMEPYGVKVVNPFELCPEQGKTDAFYMGRCIEALLTSNIIIMLPGWEESKNCRTEHYTAQQYGLQIAYDWALLDT